MADTKNQQGLASADEDTKQKVAQQGGNAVSQNTEHMSEIGKKGGQAEPSMNNTQELQNEDSSREGQTDDSR